MRRTTLGYGLALLCASAGVAAACDSGGGIVDTSAAPDDAGAEALVAEAAPHGRTLTLSLDPTIDGESDDIKATAFTSADLLDTKGRTVGRATIAGANAVFSVAGVGAGDYFVKVNGDGDDLVPTRLDDSAADVVQRVGQKLRASYVGPPSHPIYRISTWPAGQKQGPVVKFSDGTSMAGEQPYVIMTLAAPNVEFKVLGTAAPLTTFSPTAVHPIDQPFDSWILNTTGKDHHGDMFAEDGGADSCSSCHWEDWRKPLTGYGEIRSSKNWCFACHNGTEGSGAGFVDPAK